MSLDDMFKHPERYAVSDASFERMLEAREKEKRLKAGLIGFAIIVGAIVIVASVIVLATTGALRA